MIEYLLPAAGIALAIALVSNLGTAKEAAKPSKPVYKPGTGSWFIISSELNLPEKYKQIILTVDPKAFTREAKVGDLVTYSLGDGALAKKGEIVTPDNSSHIVEVQAHLVDRNPEKDDPVRGAAWNATISYSEITLGDPATMPTQLPAKGVPVVLYRREFVPFIG